MTSTTTAPAAVRRKTRKPSGLNPVAKFTIYVVLIVFSIQALLPFIWMVFGSFKTQEEYYTNIWGTPRALQWSNYRDAWVTGQVGDLLGNSIFVAVIGLVVLVFTSVLTAYCLARLEFPGKKVVFWVVLATMMVPPDIMTVPLFIILRELGLLGYQWSLSLIYAAGGFGLSTFLMRGFFMAIPRSLEEAAYIDGAGRLRTLITIILPLARSGILTVIILQGMSMWNDLYLALVFLRRPDDATVPLGLLNFFQKYTVQWPEFFAALVITALPILVLFFAFQKQFIQGMTSGSVKG